MNDNAIERRESPIVPVCVHDPSPRPQAAQQPHPQQAPFAAAQPAAQAPQPQFAPQAGHAPAPYPYPSPQPAGQAQFRPTPPTDGLAIAAFVCGLVGLALIPVVLGHISLKRIRRGERSGIGFAVVGLILGYIGIALWVVAAIAITGSVIWAVNS